MAGKDKTAFLDDELTQSAVLHQILVLGEATKRLSPEFRSRHPDVPWSEMAGMRDKLIHAYEAMDYDEVWSTATKDIPELLLWLTPLLPEEPT